MDELPSYHSQNNDFFDDKYISVHCKPATNEASACFTPVYVETDPMAIGIHHEYHFWLTDLIHAHHKDYCLAELWLVFHPWKNLHWPDLNAKLYVLVLWYSKIPPRPNWDSQMYEVYQEFDTRGQWKLGTVELSAIKGICPLAPIVKNDMPVGVTKENCFESICKYNINCYTSQSHFHKLRKNIL